MAAQSRTTLPTDKTTVLSYAGLWLLLASLAPVVLQEVEFRKVLGLGPQEAKDAAARLLAEPHPAIATALGAWLAPHVSLPNDFPVPLESLPGQHVLDQWAKSETRGVVESFPLELERDTMLVIATALVLTPRWSEGVARDEDDDMLVVTGGVQAVVQTSIGPVAVAQPATHDGVDVLSVIAAPDVAAADVWIAVDEVLRHIDDGRLPNNTFPDGMSVEECQSGHAWTSDERHRAFWGDAPEEGAELWESRLPAWSTTSSHELTSAPGVGLVTEPIIDMLPADPQEDTVVRCVQRATATYDEDGFSAAAVTAMDFVAGGAPTQQIRTVRQVNLSFDRPHALIAVARGGAWDGIPVFQAWIDPKERTVHE